MTNTHFHDNPNLIVKNRAYGYAQEKSGGYRLNILRIEVIGDLGVFTTVEDFLKPLRYQSTNPILIAHGGKFIALIIQGKGIGPLINFPVCLF